MFFVLALFENSYHFFFKSRGTPVTWVCMCRCGGGDREYIYINMRRIIGVYYDGRGQDL